MSRSASQLNIRSEKARMRADELVILTGKSITQVVEDAIRTYRPVGYTNRAAPESMEQVGRFFVRKPTGHVVTLGDTNRAIEADRDRHRSE